MSRRTIGLKPKTAATTMATMTRAKSNEDQQQQRDRQRDCQRLSANDWFGTSGPKHQKKKRIMFVPSHLAAVDTRHRTAFLPLMKAPSRSPSQPKYHPLYVCVHLASRATCSPGGGGSGSLFYRAAEIVEAVHHFLSGPLVVLHDPRHRIL